MRELVVGVDLGGTKILSGLVTREGRILKKIKQPTHSERGTVDVLDRICISIKELLTNVGAVPDEIIGMAVGAPGPLYYPQGIISSTPNLRWINLDLKTELDRRLGRPVVVDNDANMAALGEYYFGRYQSCRNLLYMTVSTGIGGGIIIDGHIYRGSKGGAGEFGHMVVEPDGNICGCGRRGCLEAVASGSAIAGKARQLIEQGKGLAIQKLTPAKGMITAREVGEAARQGDLEARLIIDQVVEWLGLGISNLVNIFNPDVVVLGGGVALGLKDLLLEPVSTYVRTHIFALQGQSLQLVVSSLEEDAGLLGCAVSVLR